MTDALSDIRTRIDEVDTRIVALIAERQTLVEAAGALKTSTDAVRAPARVEQVIERVRAKAADAGASPEVVEAAYRALIAAFIELELTVARTGDAPDN